MNKKALGKRTLAIIPCFNEEATIGSVVLRAKQYVDHILVIDDGSYDATAQIAKDAGATVVSHNANIGKSNAIKTGFRYALKNKYDFIVTIDGDGQHNPSEIPFVLKNVINNGNDVSIGIRSGTRTEMPSWRRVGKRILDYATAFGNGGFVTDSQCGFRAFNRRAVEAITPRLNGGAFTIESEQLIKAHEAGLEIGNTSVSCRYKNLRNTSTKDPASHGYSVLRYVMWLVAEQRPLLFIGFPGFLLVMIGLFFSILTLQYYNQTHIFLVPYAILISMLLIIGALGMFVGVMLNVLPSMIRRIHEGSR